MVVVLVFFFSVLLGLSTIAAAQPRPPPITIQQVSAGLFHTYARLSDGTAKCWGSTQAHYRLKPGE